MASHQPPPPPPMGKVEHHHAPNRKYNRKYNRKISLDGLGAFFRSWLMPQAQHKDHDPDASAWPDSPQQQLAKSSALPKDISEAEAMQSNRFNMLHQVCASCSQPAQPHLAALSPQGQHQQAPTLRQDFFTTICKKPTVWAGRQTSC